MLLLLARPVVEKKVGVADVNAVLLAGPDVLSVDLGKPDVEGVRVLGTDVKLLNAEVDNPLVPADVGSAVTEANVEFTAPEVELARNVALF